MLGVDTSRLMRRTRWILERGVRCGDIGGNRDWKIEVVRFSRCLGTGGAVFGALPLPWGGVGVLKLFITSCIPMSACIECIIQQHTTHQGWHKVVQPSAAGLRSPQSLLHIFRQTIFLDMEAEGRPSWRHSQLHIDITRWSSVEQQEMRDAQWSSHSRKIAQLVPTSFFQPACRMWLHDLAHIFDELCDATSDITAAHTYDH